MLAMRSVLGNVTPAEAGDKTVLGYWRFNGDTDEARKADSSLYPGGGVTSVQDANYVWVESSGGFNGGYLNITKDNYTATATLDSGVPALNGSTMPYQTLVTRFRPNKAMMSGQSGVLADVLNDTTGWHFMAMRFQSNKTGGSEDYAIMFDPRYTDSNGWVDGEKEAYGDLEIATPSATLPLVRTDTSVTIGGAISYKYTVWLSTKTQTVNFQAGLDDVMLINRMLTKREMTRLYKTGETYIWLVASDAKGLSSGFADGNGWSSKESTYLPAPGEIPGAAYIVDGNRTLACMGNYASSTEAAEGEPYTAKFGGANYDKISLTIGRTASLMNLLDPTADPIIAVSDATATSSRMYIYGSAGTDVTINDLRLNQGVIGFASPEMILRANITVNASKSSPFALSNNSGESCTLFGTVAGDGYLKKQGMGDMDLTGLTGDFRLIMVDNVKNGKVKTKQLYSYASGMVVVDTNGPVVFKDDGEIVKGTDTRVNIAFETRPPRGRYHIVTLPAKYADPSEEALFPCKIIDENNVSVSANIVREGREVYAEFPVGDFGPAPLVIGE